MQEAIMSRKDKSQLESESLSIFKKLCISCICLVLFAYCTLFNRSYEIIFLLFANKYIVYMFHQLREKHKMKSRTAFQECHYSRIKIIQYNAKEWTWCYVVVWSLCLEFLQLLSHLLFVSIQLKNHQWLSS